MEAESIFIKYLGHFLWELFVSWNAQLFLFNCAFPVTGPRCPNKLTAVFQSYAVHLKGLKYRPVNINV